MSKRLLHEEEYGNDKTMTVISSNYHRETVFKYDVNFMFQDVLNVILLVPKFDIMPSMTVSP